MKARTGFHAILLAGLSLSGPVLAQAAASPLSSADTAQALERIRAKYSLPALAVAVVKDGAVCDSAAVGVRKIGSAYRVTTNDLFHIGSCTKSMTATLVAMFIEEGRLRWDSTLAEVFPDWKGKMDPQYDAVTVEQLLTHRGGIPGAPPGLAWSRAGEQAGTPVEQREEFARAVLAEPPAAAPGTKMIYSNQGYAIAGVILEKIAGRPWETLITEKLFRPLHMDTAGFGPPGAQGQVDQPWGHTKGPQGAMPSQEDNPPAIAPAGRVHCSLNDMARYAVFQVRGEQKDGLLRAATLRKLHTPPAGGDYACGWGCVQRDWAGGRALQHSGSNTFWYMSLWLAPEKDFAVVIATNIGGSEAAKALDDVAGMMVGKWLPRAPAASGAR